ncbi:MAG: hypothetical protein A3E00_01390 [Curvibacter sp. RIFCSPHIGHO2_12_FULL_63_18]|uniref:hypothetical protein n=1 Tax=Rhodoferax sp. TaxID=50421 RepID=UPI0008AC841E|nr:hypothetical protein [Rhodoferax sp.]OGO94127.1 MAG: hypothetical protein A2037_05390 [Curvibacter sp. GWA2_63_95]OGP03303.1 MAG: hypothetical protein A3E00_01390 [Curvibacter sp. RIFCSPHIGHO2_12_FULL_63_18]HCX83409.1 hypothetical protein [Rhodoferax sp.]
MPDSLPAQRHQPRHSQLSIRLHARLEGAWQPIEAQSWNANGFCFFHTQSLVEGGMAFKRSLLHFDGALVWSRACQDAQLVLEVLLNEAIHQQAERLHDQPETRQRLLRLMRVQDMVEPKQRVLAALGVRWSAAQWQARVQERLAQSVLQSGVRVESPVWAGVVQEAMALGGVVQDLERWSRTLGAS